MKKYININKKFWSDHKAIEGRDKILIEEPKYLPVVHANAIFSLILNQAKKYSPVWLHDKSSQDLELLRSYVPAATIKKNKNLSFFTNIQVLIVSIIKLINLYFTKRILDFHYDGIKYGDIIYDHYLRYYQLATIRKIDTKMIIPIILCIRRHIEIKNILQSDNFKGVLMSHQIGIHCGVPLRVALNYGYEGYLRCGDKQATFQLFTKPDEVYNYEYKPFPSEIDSLIKKYDDKLEEEYQNVLDIQVSGKGTADGKLAFAKSIKWYKDRHSFNDDYKLNKNKNIFILLHAFNDFPHSHFRWMLFKDYYDWFINTLDFAKKNKKVNWIFKQHPSISWYVTKDVNFHKIFENCPDNVKYIDEHKQIDTRCLIHLADLVVTCTGSGGFELPAMGAIPSLVAGDTFYSDLGFALEPKSKKEYFEILDNAESIKKLSKAQQQRAKAAFVYIYKKSRVDFSAAPGLSVDEQKDTKINDWYFDKVEQKYILQKDEILKQIKKYIIAVKKANFKKLNYLSEDE
jgi:hypothetical protein